MSRKPIIFERDPKVVRRQRQMNRLLRLGTLAVVLLALVLTSLYFYQFLAREEQAARNHLRTFAELRASAVQRLLLAHKQETALWAAQAEMRKLGAELSAAWQAMSPAERASIRQMLNPAADGRRKVADTPAIDTFSGERSDAMNAFLALQRRVQGEMQAFLEHHGYANVHFVTTSGDLVFSANRRADFGANLSPNGSIYAARALGQAFQRGLRMISPGMVVFEDFQPYPGPDNAPRAFLAAPLLELEGEKIAVMIIEIDTRPIDAILQARNPGINTVSYAVGPELLLRNNLPGDKFMALKTRMDTPAVRRALDGETTTAIWKHNGRKRIGVALPMDFEDVRWAVVTEMSLAEMRAPYRPYRWLWAGAVALIVLLGGLQYWMVRRGA